MSGLDARQFLDYIVSPILQRMDMWSAAAEQLVLGTAAHESNRLTALHQENGPALGLYQIEPHTHDDLWANWLRYRNIERKALVALSTVKTAQPTHQELIWNLAYSTAVCRMLYRRISEPLPDAGDIFALANYWKKHYNTPQGKGKVNDWVLHFPMEVYR